MGKFAVWRDHSRGQRKDMRQEFYDVADLVQALTSLDPAWDTYLSQGTFRSNRRWVTNLGRICLHFIDLDTYRIPGLAGKTAEQLAELVLQVCADLGIPEPTVIMSSGRGLYVKWATTGALPQDMLPRWNEVQKTLAAALEALGADIAATDAARLLRVAQTTNSRNGQIARVLHLATGVDGGPL